MNDLIFDKSFLESQGVVDWGYTEKSKSLSYNKFQNWLKLKKNGDLSYLAGERGEKREDISFFFPEFKSAFVFLFSYSQSKKELEQFYQSDESNNLKIASYALGFEGLDYHDVLKERLLTIKDEIESQYGEFDYKLSLDIHPVLERDLAYRAGLGWFGKNSMLINRSFGSYTIIASILTAKKFAINTSRLEVDHCGQCSKCIPACPTDAIDLKTRTINTKLCISSFTIEEFKDNKIAPSGLETSGGYVFGCDICQDVCPWNVKELKKVVIKTATNKDKRIFDFFLKQEINSVVEKLGNMSNRYFRKVFKQTSFERLGRIGILKNLKIFK